MRAGHCQMMSARCSGTPSVNTMAMLMDDRVHWNRVIVNALTGRLTTAHKFLPKPVRACMSRGWCRAICRERLFVWRIVHGIIKKRGYQHVNARSLATIGF